jgi:hypothetical protein
MSHRLHSSTPALAGLLLLSVALAGCQSGRAPVATGPNRTALSTMERVAINANTCWFKSADPAFAAYRLAPELNSFSGRPRFLVVPRNSPESRPVLVVEAQGNPARLNAFGPMMGESTSARISHDVTRWANGAKGC